MCTSFFSEDRKSLPKEPAESTRGKSRELECTTARSSVVPWNFPSGQREVPRVRWDYTCGKVRSGSGASAKYGEKHEGTAGQRGKSSLRGRQDGTPGLQTSGVGGSPRFGKLTCKSHVNYRLTFHQTRRSGPPCQEPEASSMAEDHGRNEGSEAHRPQPSRRTARTAEWK